MRLSWLRPFVCFCQVLDREESRVGVTCALEDSCWATVCMQYQCEVCVATGCRRNYARLFPGDVGYNFVDWQDREEPKRSERALVWARNECWRRLMCWLDWKKTNSRSSGVDTDCVMAETQNTMHFEWRRQCARLRWMHTRWTLTDVSLRCTIVVRSYFSGSVSHQASSCFACVCRTWRRSAASSCSALRC